MFLKEVLVIYESSSIFLFSILTYVECFWLFLFLFLFFSLYDRLSLTVEPGIQEVFA